MKNHKNVNICAGNNHQFLSIKARLRGGGCLQEKMTNSTYKESKIIYKGGAASSRLKAKLSSFKVPKNSIVRESFSKILIF